SPVPPAGVFALHPFHPPAPMDLQFAISKRLTDAPILHPPQSSIHVDRETERERPKRATPPHAPQALPPVWPAPRTSKWPQTATRARSIPPFPSPAQRSNSSGSR